MLSPVPVSMLNVRGSSNANAMVADRPGIAPTNSPSKMPPNMAAKLVRVSTLANPIMTIELSMRYASSVAVGSDQEIAEGRKGTGKPRNSMNTRHTTAMSTAVPITEKRTETVRINSSAIAMKSAVDSR